MLLLDAEVALDSNRRVPPRAAIAVAAPRPAPVSLPPLPHPAPLSLPPLPPCAVPPLPPLATSKTHCRWRRSWIRYIHPDPDPAPPTGAGPNSVAIGMSLVRTFPTSEAHISPLESVAPQSPAPHVTWKSEHMPDLRRSLLRLNTDCELPPRRRRCGA
ncbi:hypothetical protein E2562_038815 [Oryza meyeriana var. granulata]|uniref:Uncharacterized protein n=1 Tax=Oryza meyeriana var. granulata TaxID=110450 RepID=A0A6G1DU90_9ORYZ|nr:hypothetical protein E2562_038815 [Oryza meyeriana var. granulata]